MIRGKMIHADMRMNPIHFRSNPADIPIQINQEIWIQIRDHILALSATLSECFCCCC